MSGADVLVMDDPARGVDVGAKVELYRVIAGHAESGGAVVLASSDLDELLALSRSSGGAARREVVATFTERPFRKAEIVAVCWRPGRPGPMRRRNRPMKLAGKAVIVTGGTRGIGKALVEKLVGGRRRMWPSAMSPASKRAADMRRRLPGKGRAASSRCAPMCGTAREVEAFVARTSTEFGRIDSAMNNAHQAYEGRASRKPPGRTSSARSTRW